ncbi:MAG: HAD hydrolase-like protein, partial [Ghiorsea sp.]
MPRGKGKDFVVDIRKLGRMMHGFSFDLAVIDLDNTLYAADNGVFSRMDTRMNAYICRELGIDDVEADAMRMRYWREYGSTLKGLMLHHGQQAEPFLHEVHDIQADELLAPCEKLSHTLSQIQAKKVIHTNGTQEHAETVLKGLGIRHFFADIYDIRYNQYTPKPCAETLTQLFAAEGVKSDKVLVIDDMQD